MTDVYCLFATEYALKWESIHPEVASVEEEKYDGLVVLAVYELKKHRELQDIHELNWKNFKTKHEVVEQNIRD